ncbi:MAG TPA: response regulator transcription factor, partial [Chloroflexota bacterium]|nr:response regulator transcription factor [Chloroflexota bacterium]
GVVLSVYVVSPLPAVRAGLRALVGEADDLRVAGEAPSLEALARGPGRERAALDVVVLDAPPGTGGAGGAEGGEEGADLSWPEGEGPRPALVVLGPVAGDERLAGELAGRGWAYLSREAGGEQLIAAIRAAGSGLVTLDPALAAGLLVRPLPSGPGGLAAPEGAMGAEAELTLREGEVLGLVAEGLANKAIARRLGISEHTVKFHVAAILAKLGAGSRTEAVRLGAQRGLVAL